MTIINEAQPALPRRRSSALTFLTAGIVAGSLMVSTIAAAQDITIRWALHPGEEADAVINYFAPKYE
ncbi:hypothetical protein E4656_19715, partial [Natronospirillum operosum]